MPLFRRFSVSAIPILVLVSLWFHPRSVGVTSAASLTNEESRTIWLDDSIGGAFRKGLLDVGFSLGAGLGTKVFGSSLEHDLSVASFHVGWIFSDLMAKETWYRGNWELLGELFAGGQFNPGSRYLAGLTSVIRYNFMTCSRWIPFLDGGVGVSLTDIGNPDLSGSFEFNVQVGAGIHYFYQKDKALTLQFRHLHLSCAGIDYPNRGTNTEMVMAGFSWYF